MDMDNKQALLDMCILDHLRRKGFNQTAEIFQREAGVSEPINQVQGLLSDWWGLFADTYSSRRHARREEDPLLGGNVSSYLQFGPRTLGHRTTVPADHHLVNSRQIMDQVPHAGQNNVQAMNFFPGPSGYQGVQSPFMMMTPRGIPFTPVLTRAIDGFPEFPIFIGGQSSRQIPGDNVSSYLQDLQFVLRSLGHRITLPEAHHLVNTRQIMDQVPHAGQNNAQAMNFLPGPSGYQGVQSPSMMMTPREIPFTPGLTRAIDGFPEFPNFLGGPSSRQIPVRAPMMEPSTSFMNNLRIMVERDKAVLQEISSSSSGSNSHESQEAISPLVLPEGQQK